MSAAVLIGCAGTGAPARGDSYSVAADPVAGDPVAGDPVAGDPVAGDPVAGDPVAGDPGPPTLGSITPAALSAALTQKDFLLLNVHIPRQGEIPGTDAHIPYNDVDQIAQAIGTNLDRHTVIYCKTDGMSRIAGPALVARGYRRIDSLAGGMNAWVAAGYGLDP